MSALISIEEIRSLPGMPKDRRSVERLLNRIGARRIKRGFYSRRDIAFNRLPAPARAKFFASEFFASERVNSNSELIKKSLNLQRDGAGAARAESGRSPHADSVPVAETGGARSVLERGSRKALERADAQTEIVLAFRNFHQQAGGTRRAALRAFVARYNQCLIEGISAETRARYLTLNGTTLLRWLSKFERGGPEALTRKESKRRDASIIAMTPGMVDYILALISKTPHIRATRVYEGLCARFDRVPSRRAVQNWISRWKAENPALMMRLRDPDDYKRRFIPALGDAAANIALVGQLFEIDGTEADVMCLDGRWHLNAVIDVRSRKMCVLLTPTASADATARLLLKAIPAMGLPQSVKGDWGKEFQNSRIRRACLRLGFFTIDKVARPYSGELKPFVERGIGTLLHMFFEQCPGYLGHSVAQGAEIRARNSFQARRGERRNLVKLYNVKLTASELQELLDRWLEAVYGNRPHAGLHGSTPNAEFAAGEARGEVRRVADERLLDVLFGEDGTAVVGSKGIRAGAQFWDDALIEWRGRKIQFVRTRDAGRVLIFSDEEKPKFICVAIDLNAEGVDRAVVAIAAKQREKQYMSEKLAELRRMRREHHPERLMEEIISHAEAREAAKLSPETNITAMPAQGEGLREAAAALAALETKPSAPLEHPDREQVEREYEETVRADAREIYDEAADAAATVERFIRLRATPRARWSGDDCEFWELCQALPEIKDLLRRSA